MSQLILWNDTKYSHTLSKFFGRENIICNKEELSASLRNWNKFSSLVVLCELNWSASGAAPNMQHLHGIELVKELRRTHHVTLPILFVSFHSLTEIFNAEREIITAIGHDFYQLPAVPEDFKTFMEKEFGANGSTRKLSVMELNDIKSFYCSKEGILSHELHYLNRYLNFEITEKNHENTYNDFCEAIKKIHELFLLDVSHSINSFQSLFPALNKSNISEAVNHIIRIGNTLRNKYDIKSGINKDRDTLTDSYRWKVLLLDDEITEQHELVKCMKENGVNVICAYNADEAINILKEDWASANSIMVVIADYRLYENHKGVKRHQKIQGYQFLKMIASSDQLVRLVAFSGLQRKFLLNSFKHYNIRTEVKSKIDYLSDDHTYQLFTDEIIELAEENWEAIEALPSKCAGFAKYLEEAYKTFRSSPDYDKMENNVSLTATEYVREIEEQIKNKEEIKIGAIENIKSPLAKTIKDQEAFFRRLQNYLVARRIALWLYAAQKKGLPVKIDSRQIAEILTDQKYPTDAYRQILSTSLGLSLDDFPKNITIEERRWLQYDMALNIFKDVEAINFSFYKIQKHFADFIKADNSLCDYIHKNDFVLSYKYKNTEYKIYFHTNLTPILKTSTDIRVLYLIIEARSKKR